MKKNTCVFGGIIKYSCGDGFGYGFKIVFKDSKTAQKYKEMFAWILKDDKFKLSTMGGYYDKQS